MSTKDSEAYEDLNVHQVYEQIASHFSSTRYKPWPIVEKFLQELPPGSVGLDAGCGNGKYLTVNRSIFMLASDRSSNLIKFAAQHEPHDALVADTLSLPHPLASFDFAISIAAIHHLSTPERRVDAVKHLLDHVKASNGKVLIFVWALEQKSSRRGWDEGHQQDVMVPWVMKAGGKAKSDTKANARNKTKTNKMAGAHDHARSGEEAKVDDTASPDNQTNEDDQAKERPGAQDQTFHRYYHLYRRGELEDDVQRAGGYVLDSGYERDNWWAIASRSK